MTDQHLEVCAERAESEASVRDSSARSESRRERGGWLEHPEQLVGDALLGMRRVLRLTRDIQNLPVAYLCGWIERQVRLWPALPAATMWSVQVGVHAHSHLPYLPTPSAPPMLMPSLGPVALGCSPNVLIGGRRAARQGDMGCSMTCGGFMPLFTIETGSATVLIGGNRAARTGDFTQSCRPLSSPPAGRDPLSALLALKLGPLVELHDRIQFWWSLFAPLADAASRLLAPVITDAELTREHTPEELRALEQRRTFEEKSVQEQAPEVVVMLALRYLPLVQSRAFKVRFPGGDAAVQKIALLGEALGRRGLAGLSRMLASAPLLRASISVVGQQLLALLPARLPGLNVIMTDAPVIRLPHALVAAPALVNIGGLPIPSTDTMLRAFRGVAGRVLSLRLPKAQQRLARRLVPQWGGYPYVC